jgi:hypothetical protein
MIEQREHAAARRGSQDNADQQGDCQMGIKSEKGHGDDLEILQRRYDRAAATRIVTAR